MKIGELSERTGIPTRMLRYYESQGLIAPVRTTNGYRSYGEDDVQRAAQVRGLIQAGLTTRMAAIVLDIEEQCERGEPAECSRALAQQLADQLDVLDQRLTCLTRSRDAVARFLEQTRNGDLIRSGGAVASA
jgi:DNA-binding transcriptional MerR regulator